MSLILVVKSYQGTVSHWFEQHKGTLCGKGPGGQGRSSWRQWRDQSPEGKNICPKCAKIKAARDQQRQDITEGLMVAQAVEASRYED